MDTIKPADIKLVQSFKNPPAAIKLVMEAVCVCLDVKPAKIPDPAGTGRKIDDYWGPSKLLLGQHDVRAVAEGVRQGQHPGRGSSRSIREKYIANEDFTPENAAKASSAAEGLCRWVCAMDSYEKVAKVVEPKKKRSPPRRRSTTRSWTALKVKQDELDAILAALAGMEQAARGLHERRRNV